MDNLHILQPKNKENHKPIEAHKQEYPLRVPVPYNNSQNQNCLVILRNRTRAASINLCVTHAKCHILDILNNKHKYGLINNTMTLLKHFNKTSLLLPYEQLYIQTNHQHKQLISEQYIGEQNPIYQLIHNTFNTSLALETSRSIPYHQHN